MEVTEEFPTSDDTEHQCDSVDNTEPTSLVYAKSEFNPQTGTICM